MAPDLPRLVLIGAYGQLGFELQRALSVLGTVIALGHEECDLSDAQAVVESVSRFKPDIIVNAAAWTAVDRAESQPEAAFTVNADGARALACAARQCDALLVHYSTDYVFDGAKTDAYQEEDIPAPLSAYGRSKLAGEQAVAQAGCRHLIFRTSWVFGAYGANFMKTVLRLARERERLSMVSDQTGAPTGAALIADITAQILAQYLRSPARDRFPYGLYHLASAGATNWRQYAQFIVEQASALGMPILLRAVDIAPIPTSAYPLPAVRPANSLLDTRKLRTSFGLTLPAWEEGVIQALHLLAQS